MARRSTRAISRRPARWTSAEWLIQEEITVCFMVASTFRQLVSTLTGGEQFPKLRLIRIGGEPVYPKDVALYKRHFAPGCILLNSLGSSEMKNFSEYFIDRADKDRRRPRASRLSG